MDAATIIAATATANASYERGDYTAAIPLYQTCIQVHQHQQSLGSLSMDSIYSSMEKLATCYTKTREYDKAILVNNERYKKMCLGYGDCYPRTLSALHRLACDYSNKGDIYKAISLHEECLCKRTSMLGASHDATLESIRTLSKLKAKVDKHESLFGKMKAKYLIELIDRRKLNRVGLHEKSELVRLLTSHVPANEKRGATLKLFQAYRKLTLSRNKDPSYWTIARVSALINGNHEILKPNCRFGNVDPATTLTHDARCSLIDMLLTNHCDSTSKHPVLDVSYKEAVGEKANLFVSFAYADSFIDLVDALELYMETHAKEHAVESTYFWFDLFVNDQWTARPSIRSATRCASCLRGAIPRY